MPDKFKIAAIFSDNMVLQRGKNISVFGEGKDGAVISLTLNGYTAKTAVRDGKWLAVLPPMEAHNDLTMTVACGSEKIVFNNIAVGEVWFAGGQSNMEFELKDCPDGQKAVNEDVSFNIRYYHTYKNPYMDERFYREERESRWSLFNKDNAEHWSAAAYFFAKKLADEHLGKTVAIGIIGCYWGGTSASVWMSRESLEKDFDLKTYLDEYDDAVAGKTPEQANAEYNKFLEYHEEWNRKIAEFYTNNPNGEWDDCLAFCGENKWPGPHAPKNPCHAAALYDSMLRRVCPYTIAGFIYYQGESDDYKPHMYYKLFTNMIDLWRTEWGDAELPFLFAQLTMHRYKADPDYKHWCLIREAQMKVFQTVKNTGIAVIIDCGEFNEIHPKNKKPVGERLALQALYHVYGRHDIDVFSPVYKSHIIKDNGIEISFKYSSSFKVAGGITGFEIAGADKNYIKADAEIRGDKIFVYSDALQTPLYVRYLWANYGEVTLYSNNGMPLAPFRTD